MARQRLMAKLGASFLSRPSVINHVLATQPGRVTSEMLECAGNPAAFFSLTQPYAPEWDPVRSPIPAELPLIPALAGGGGGGAWEAEAPPFPFEVQHLPSREFVLKADIKLDACVAKVLEMSAAEGAAGGRALDGEAAAALRALADVLSRPQLFFSSKCPEAGLRALLGTLAWAPARVWPSLDLLRVALLHLGAAAQAARAPENVLPALLALCGTPAAAADYRVPLLASRALANLVKHGDTRELFREGLPLVVECAQALLRHDHASVKAEGANLLYNAVHCVVDAVPGALGRVAPLPAFLSPLVLARLMAGLHAALGVPGARATALIALGSLVMTNAGLKGAGQATAGIAALREGLKEAVARVQQEEAAADVKETAATVLLMLAQVARNTPEFADLVA